jgi:hypothetical protein
VQVPRAINGVCGLDDVTGPLVGVLEEPDKLRAAGPGQRLDHGRVPVLTIPVFAIIAMDLDEAKVHRDDEVDDDFIPTFGSCGYLNATDRVLAKDQSAVGSDPVHFSSQTKEEGEH